MDGAEGRLPNPLLALRADLSALLFLLGVALSFVAAIALAWQTARQRQRQALAQAQTQASEDRRRFLRRLDHELKNPLTAMRAGLANLSAHLGEDTSGNERSRKILTSIETQTVRLSQLTADLRKLSDLETFTLERTPVNLATLLQEALELAQEKPQAQGRRFTLSTPQAPWPLPAISGDWDLLFLATYNLLDNAVKFTRSGDTIEVRAFEDGPSVVIEVADTGPGIAEADAPHVWEELYRGEGARGVPGSGLGLALVRAIVERHGGQVTLRTRAGQGTVVTARLPVREL